MNPFCYLPRSEGKPPAWVNLTQITSAADLTEPGSPPVVVCHMTDKQKLIVSGDQAKVLMQHLCFATAIVFDRKNNSN